MTKREIIAKAPKYASSASWQRKVSLMSEDQVTAIYLRFLRAGLVRDQATK